MGYTLDYGVLMGPRPAFLDKFLKGCYDHRGALQFGLLVGEGKLRVTRDGQGEIVKLSQQQPKEGRKESVLSFGQHNGKRLNGIGRKIIVKWDDPPSKMDETPYNQDVETVQILEGQFKDDQLHGVGRRMTFGEIGDFGDGQQLACDVGLWARGQIEENINSVGVYEVGGSVANSKL